MLISYQYPNMPSTLTYFLTFTERMSVINFLNYQYIITFLRAGVELEYNPKP